MLHSARQVDTADGISWHVERFHATATTKQEEWMILIPSGEGDCQSLLQLGELLSTKYGYSVITFDMPGFSRTQAPPSAYDKISPRRVASQIHNLCVHLGIEEASAFGCSSGGTTILALIERLPSFIKCGVIHEVPLSYPEVFHEMLTLDDEKLSEALAGLFANVFVERKDLWEALGPEYHQRLRKNYVTWLRRGISIVTEGIEMATNGTLTKKPLLWTVGALNPGMENGAWKADFEYAKAAGLIVNTTGLPSLHFPAVTVPEATARWIDTCVSGV